MGKPVNITRPENETAAQLKGISPELMLGVPRAFGAGAGLRIVASQQMKQVGALELHGGISLAFFVNEQREGDACFLAKGACVDAIPQSHGGQVRSSVAKGLLIRAQLRDVLAAEDSTVMPEENDDGGLANPQRTKSDSLAVQVWQGNHGKPAVEASFHGATF